MTKRITSFFALTTFVLAVSGLFLRPILRTRRNIDRRAQSLT